MVSFLGLRAGRSTPSFNITGFQPARPGPSTSSGQGLRQAQARAFDRLRPGPSTGSGQGLRQAQARAFDRLRPGPSTGSGQGLRQAQARAKPGHWTERTYRADHFRSHESAREAKAGVFSRSRGQTSQCPPPCGPPADAGGERWFCGRPPPPGYGATSWEGAGLSRQNLPVQAGTGTGQRSRRRIFCDFRRKCRWGSSVRSLGMGAASNQFARLLGTSV